MKVLQWTSGNTLTFLENGEEFFPRVFELIDRARSSVSIETFIVADDEVGQRLQRLLIAAARRGVSTQLVMDGYGSAPLPPEYVTAMTDAGVVVRWFDPRPPLLGVRTNMFRRLHRKLVVLDDETAFIGGINFTIEHLRKFGALSKQDYAVEVRGPVVAQVAQAMAAPPPARRFPGKRLWQRLASSLIPEKAGKGARAVLLLRDNQEHPQDIEWMYRVGIRAARREIVIANAYFFPGYRLLRDLRKAAKRGVAVHLILQGRPDMPSVRWLAGTLYDYLLRGGVRIHEYCERPLHAKVAVIDGTWATVGSSNLDPLSLFLNLEANLMVEDELFAAEVGRHLHRLIQGQCRELVAPKAGPSTLIRNAIGFGAFHVLRRLPGLVGWLPAHADERTLLQGAEAAVPPVAGAR